MVILLISIATHTYLNFDRKEAVHRFLFILIVLTIAVLLLEIFSVLLNSVYYIKFMTIHKTVDTLGFALTPWIPVAAALYVYKRTNRYKRLKMANFFWLGIPVVVSSFLSLGSSHYNWIFSITNENIYMRGPLFFVVPMTVFFYYVVNLLFLYDSRNKLHKQELIVLSLLSVIPAAMSVFQLHYFIYLTIWNSTAISIVINYIFFIHSQTKIDPLTGLGNRLAYDECLASFQRKSNIVLSVVNMDLDDFKSINDIYGHHEGDKVLRVFAQAIKDVFEEKGIPIRVGGDEFIVLLSENKKKIIEKDIKILIGKINAYNEKSDMPYRINFSYGMTIYDNSYNNLHELVQQSDKLMYKEKQCKAAENIKLE